MLTIATSVRNLVAISTNAHLALFLIYFLQINILHNFCGLCRSKWNLTHKHFGLWFSSVKKCRQLSIVDQRCLRGNAKGLRPVTSVRRVLPLGFVLRQRGIHFLETGSRTRAGCCEIMSSHSMFLHNLLLSPVLIISKFLFYRSIR
jgi:hypothetical protein